MSTAPQAVLGVDLGGTKLIAALAAPDGSILREIEQPTRHGAGTPALDQIVELGTELLATAGLPAGRLAAAVVGVPGSVSPRTGLVSLAPNVALPTDRPLAAAIAERLGCPVLVENDVNIAAFGEARQPGRQSHDSLAFLSFGTGVGLGLVLGGRLIRGANGAAGEIAYLPTGAEPHARAGTAVGGLFEDTVSSPAIVAAYGDGVPVIDIFARAVAGEAHARAVLDSIAKTASVGVAAIQAIFDPAIVVLGGSIGARSEFADAVRRHAVTLLPLPIEIETSTLGRRAGIVGAVEAAADLARRH